MKILSMMMPMKNQAQLKWSLDLPKFNRQVHHMKYLHHKKNNNIKMNRKPKNNHQALNNLIKTKKENKNLPHLNVKIKLKMFLIINP